MCRSCSILEDPEVYADNKRPGALGPPPSHGVDLRAAKRAEVRKRITNAVTTGNVEQLSKLLSEARGVNQSDTTSQAEYLLGVR